MTQQNTHDNKIVKRVAKDDKNPYGIIDAKSIPVDVPCIVAIGGERTTTRKDANYYASLLNKLLLSYGINDIGIYSAYYDFEDTNRNAERAKLFDLARKRIKNRQQTLDAHNDDYVRDLYQNIIFPRIVTARGTRFSDDAAIRNLRNVLIFTHCHGAAVVRVFQDMMVSDLQKYGYNKLNFAKIMKSLLVIQHAPVAPIHHQLFNTISFMSASDSRMDFHNDFTKYAVANNEDIAPSYFELGNFFTAYCFTHQMIDEHSIIGLLPDKEQDMLTSYGATIMAAERNAIINAIRAIKNGDESPLTAQKLISPASESDKIKPDFDELKSNGDFFMYIMHNDLHTTKNKTR